MIYYTYNQAVEVAFENLHLKTKEIKDDINLQMYSDRENLYTMASIAANLYSEGKSYDVLFQSFKSIGLIEEIGILTPENNFLTKMGSVKSQTDMTFSAEVQKSPYISGIVNDATHSKRKIIRTSVPIVSRGDTVGILYGLIYLVTLKNHYKPMADSSDARLYIIERGNGDFVVDTWREERGNLHNAKVIESRRGYSYDNMRQDIFDGKNGFCVYRSNISHTMMYTHYSSIGISDWHIVLSVPESIVLEQAEETRSTLLTVFAAVVFLMLIYVLMIISTEKKASRVVSAASAIRKLLLDANNRSENMNKALRKIADFVGGRSAFYIDIAGKDYNSIVPSGNEKPLTDPEREYLISQLFDIALMHKKGLNITIMVYDIVSQLKVEKSHPDFYKFLKDHKINEITFAAITGKDSQLSILAVANAKKTYIAKELLAEIAVCFSISVSNKNYLVKTEQDAVTDALTGISNRVAYKKDVSVFDTIHPENLACIYVDVNELHVYNNRYGHAAGDEMLIYVANAISDIFSDSYTYRMGGDEFLVFTRDLHKDEVKKRIESLVDRTEEKGYHISIGMTYSIKNIETESLVRDAEKRMYDAKAKYYQNKEKKSIAKSGERKFKFIDTGIKDLDMMIKVLSGHYSGIYSVSLETDIARRIIMPSYMDFKEQEERFSEIMHEYILNTVHPDFHRGMLRFLNYDVLKKQLDGGEYPSIVYKKLNGESIILTVYAQGDETLWVFENA
jgi:diguanylate cyclase (GGDEF)-like protein